MRFSCSAYSSAVYLKDVIGFPKDKKVLIVGEKGIEEELEAAGIQYVGGTDTTLRKVDPTEEDIDALHYDPSIGAVLCGLDWRDPPTSRLPMPCCKFNTRRLCFWLPTLIRLSLLMENCFPELALLLEP